MFRFLLYFDAGDSHLSWISAHVTAHDTEEYKSEWKWATNAFIIYDGSN